MTATDAAGNSASASSMSWSDIRNLLTYTWSPSLWPDETWELQILAKRRTDSPFEPGELAVFQGVDKPVVGQTQSLSETRSVGGVKITLTEFLLKPPIKGNSWSSSETSYLKMSVVGVPPGTYVDLVGATDSKGTVHHSDSWSSSGSDRQYSFRSLPEESERLTFTFSVQAGRRFTFRVRPEIASTNIVFR